MWGVDCDKRGSIQIDMCVCVERISRVDLFKKITRLVAKMDGERQRQRCLGTVVEGR